QSPERRERCAWFYRVIEKHVTAAVSCQIDVAGLKRAIRSFQWPPMFRGADFSPLENPYYCGFKAIIDVLAQQSKALCLHGPVDFIFDEEHEKDLTLKAWSGIKYFSAPEFRDYMGDTPLYRDDRTTMPLQAADLYAWWVRKWALEKNPDGLAS